jgi:hypothetical protein
LNLSNTFYIGASLGSVIRMNNRGEILGRSSDGRRGVLWQLNNDNTRVLRDFGAFGEVVYIRSDDMGSLNDVGQVGLSLKGGGPIIYNYRTGTTNANLNSQLRALFPTNFNTFTLRGTQ